MNYEDNVTRSQMRKFDFYQYLGIVVVGVASSLIAWGLTQNWTVASITIGVFVVLIIIFRFFYPKAEALITFKKCGIINVHTNQYEAKKSIQDKLHHVSNIDILTIRGLGVFALKDSLIKKTLIQKAGQIKVRVLFLNPDSKFVETRANEVGEDIEAFRQGILLAQGYLKELKTQHKVDIKANMYDMLPVWRFKFIDNFVYVSSFQPSKEGHRSAMYEIMSNGDFSLYSSFKREFDFLFSHSKVYLK